MLRVEIDETIERLLPTDRASLTHIRASIAQKQVAGREYAFDRGPDDEVAVGVGDAGMKDFDAVPAEIDDFSIGYRAVRQA